MSCSLPEEDNGEPWFIKKVPHKDEFQAPDGTLHKTKDGFVAIGEKGQGYDGCKRACNFLSPECKFISWLPENNRTLCYFHEVRDNTHGCHGQADACGWKKSERPDGLIQDGGCFVKKINGTKATQDFNAEEAKSYKCRSHTAADCKTVVPNPDPYAVTKSKSVGGKGSMIHATFLCEYVSCG